ncbi:hypothetical protein [Sinorhizobium mexicanum]|uniref:Uncharacterized protein n=1 Tax=Sinorhizobium mexicanum TaxID=375549 RepID=A0A859QKK7_9HYPH|nr:hypothetical protein [Sinorhizobium mexicanum]MBP1885882.1 hypothetical protein [Sinorhizobium mexicanum]QLL60546.1 hypothetical protein FKV68_03355 [Sinorhizobium mexicanum]
MARIRVRLFLATAIVATSMAPTVGFPQDFELYIGPDGQGYYDDYRPRYYDEYRPRRYYRERYREGYQCTKREALYLSRQYLRSPRVGRTTRYAIEVRGTGRRGERNRVTFANEPGCPRID